MIGQVIAGADVLEMEYAPAEVDQVVVCEVGDPVLEAVCERRGFVGGWLRSMRERAKMLGGSLRVDSEPGTGTRVELRVPLDGWP